MRQRAPLGMKTAAFQKRALAADAGAKGLAWPVGAEGENQASTVIGKSKACSQ